MDFWRFSIPEELGEQIVGQYSTDLVLLSVAFASLAALAALSVVDRIALLRRRQGSMPYLWLIVGGFAMGSGVWAMHFTGMLAYRMPVAMNYGLLVTLFSMLPAMIGSGFALSVMSDDTVNWWHLQIGGLLMAVGIGTMHYTGMEAMIMDAELRYDFWLFVLSIGVAHVLATASLYVRFVIGGAGKSGLIPRLIGAIAMGCAVAGMHYTAMAAARFYPVEQAEVSAMLMPPGLMAVGVAAIVMLITALTILGAVIDQRLTEASDSVLDSATRYEKVLATMADGFAVIREDRTIETLNDAARRAFGVDAKESGAAAGVQLNHLVQLDDASSDALAHFEKTGDSYLLDLSTAIRGRRQNGDLFPVDLALGKMEIRGQTFYTCSIRDVSERRALENRLSHAQKMESIGQLAAGIAHEINTPTQYVSDNTRFLQDAFNDILKPLKILRDAAADTDGELDQEKLKAVVTAVEDADIEYLLEETPLAISQCLDGLERIATIVRAMKEFSHPSTEKTNVDINRAIESTITVASNEWKYVAKLTTELDPQLPQVSCLPGDFNQAILNIIVNAAHAIGDNRTGDELGHITVSTSHDDKWAEVRIADDGPGIPAEIRERIFDPFFTTKEVGKGTGQGLSIAHSTIVQKHGGEFFCESEVGKGTCFVIRLPLDTGSGDDSDTEPSSADATRAA